MATITRFPGLRHLRAEPNFHIVQYRGGQIKRSGRGISFWYSPLSTSLAEVPCDDRDETFLFHGRSSDFQDVTTQGVISYRVVDPDVVAQRVDFSIDPKRGTYLKTPLEQLSQLLIQAAQQQAWAYLAQNNVRELLVHGVEAIRERITSGLTDDPKIVAMGLEIVSVRVSGVTPTAELEKALQAPANEAIQQEADEATFQRRALAVEKERAIAENELQNKIELAKREEKLIAQQGKNARDQASENAQAQKIDSDALAARRGIEARAEADAFTAVETARVNAERERMTIYRDMPSQVMLGLAAQQLAGKLDKIEHLNVSPELLGPLLQRLIQAGTDRLEE